MRKLLAEAWRADPVLFIVNSVSLAILIVLLVMI